MNNNTTLPNNAAKELHNCLPYMSQLNTFVESGSFKAAVHYIRVMQTLLNIPKGLILPGRKTSIF